jgi:hypothetical protein
LIVVAVVFDEMGWPLLNTWALIHGEFIPVWVMLIFFSWALLLAVDYLWRHRRRRPSQIQTIFSQTTNDGISRTR